MIQNIKEFHHKGWQIVQNSGFERAFLTFKMLIEKLIGDMKIGQLFRNASSFLKIDKIFHIFLYNIGFFSLIFFDLTLETHLQ